MKTAEELIAERGNVTSVHYTHNFGLTDKEEKENNSFILWIKEIQLDAWCEGMNDASDIARRLEPSDTLGIPTAIETAILLKKINNI